MVRVLDRRVHFDERSRDFPVRALVPDSRPIRGRGWHLPTQLDQGEQGACVGFAWAHELAAAPVKVAVDNDAARALYHAAQQVDEWPGDDYEGSSVLAGAKTVKALGHMDEYRWAFSTEDVLRALSYLGPVVLGLNWRTGMFSPDPNGYVHPAGDVEGGHAIVAVAVHVRQRRILLQNSWGSDWGINGRCYLSWSDLDRLLADDGECCIPVLRR